MKTRMILLTLAFCLLGVVASFADDANVGTWKLNEGKSKIAAGTVKNTRVVYTAEGDSYKCVVEGVDSSGQAIHHEWTGKFDGKEYPVTGDPSSDARAVTKVDDRHYKIVSKKGGKVTSTSTVAFSPDGKTRTLNINTTDAKGKKAASTWVYDKQ